MAKTLDGARAGNTRERLVHSAHSQQEDGVQETGPSDKTISTLLLAVEDQVSRGRLRARCISPKDYLPGL